MRTFGRSQGDRSFHVRHLLRRQNFNGVGRSHLSSHDTFFAEGSILPLTVTDLTALARGPTLRLRHRECAQLALLHTRAVCDQTGFFSEAIMIAFFLQHPCEPLLRKRLTAVLRAKNARESAMFTKPWT